MTLVAKRPTRNTAATVVARPRPGISLPVRFVKNGPANPSITPKIQTRAATLMTSGTVMKNPAMKLLRIHWSMVRQMQPLVPTGASTRRARRPPARADSRRNHPARARPGTG